MFWTICVICLLLFCIIAVYEFFAAFGKGGEIVGIILNIFIILVASHAWLCANVSWYGQKVEPPAISVTVNGEPVLGEEAKLCDDGKYYITITDHRLYADDWDDSPDIKIQISPDSAQLKKAKLKLEVVQAAMKNPPTWISQEERKGKTDSSTSVFTYTIDGSKLRMNESAKVEPTEFIITASNVAGQDTKTLVVIKYPLYYACEKYTNDHPGHNSVDDIPLCRQRSEYSSKSTNNSNNSSNSSNSNLPSNTSKPTNNSSGSNHSSSCTHYESGRCWDDLENSAYDSGQWDKNFGHHGGGYNPPDDCTGICLDIYDDAYYEGYDDY